MLLVHTGSGGRGFRRHTTRQSRRHPCNATAAVPEKVQVCKDLGADIAIDYKAADFVDIVKKEQTVGTLISSLILSEAIRSIVPVNVSLSPGASWWSASPADGFRKHPPITRR
ncbi:hypothetical protein [Natribacillus halophilus]|uniref:hypothetical protein n=1 Tax=Natribacillus halophilus TaxID=549003 RepID=UPI003CCBF3AD